MAETAGRTEDGWRSSPLSGLDAWACGEARSPVPRARLVRPRRSARSTGTAGHRFPTSGGRASVHTVGQALGHPSVRRLGVDPRATLNGALDAPSAAERATRPEGMARSERTLPGNRGVGQNAPGIARLGTSTLPQCSPGRYRLGAGHEVAMGTGTAVAPHRRTAQPVAIMHRMRTMV